MHKFVHDARPEQTERDAPARVHAAATEIQSIQVRGAVAVAQECGRAGVARRPVQGPAPRSRQGFNLSRVQHLFAHDVRSSAKRALDFCQDIFPELPNGRIVPLLGIGLDVHQHKPVLMALRGVLWQLLAGDVDVHRGVVSRGAVLLDLSEFLLVVSAEQDVVQTQLRMHSLDPQ